MQEFKCVATDRLRHEGKWNEACRSKKEEERRRLRSQGIKRQQAIELAWTATLTEFPPRYMTALSKCRTRMVKAETWIEDNCWSSAWWAICSLLAWRYIQDDYPGDYGLEQSLVKSQVKNSPNDYAQFLFSGAFRFPASGIKAISEHLDSMIERVSGTPETTENVCIKSELEHYREKICPQLTPALALSFQKHAADWAEALTPDDDVENLDAIWYPYPFVTGPDLVQCYTFTDGPKNSPLPLSASPK